MSFAVLLAEDQRLVLLRLLTEMPSNSANEVVLRQGLATFGHKPGSDVVRSHLQFLADNGLVTKAELPVKSGTLWVIGLTRLGEEVAEGRKHPGVALRGPD